MILETLKNAVVSESDLRNDVVEHFKRNAVIDENLEDFMSEAESCKSQSSEQEAVDMDENAIGDDVKESQSIDEKLLKDKESFAYKLRRLRAQLFEENGNGSMSSPSIEKYEKMVKKFVSKFKNYKMPKGVRLLKYEVDLWEKKVIDTKEALASDVNEVKDGSTATTRASELSEEVNAVVTGIKSNPSVSLASSPGSITCSHCGSIRNPESGVEMHDGQVHEGSRRLDDSNEGLKRLIEVEVRRQIWPEEKSADGRKISNAEYVGKLDLPDVPDEDIVMKHTTSPAKVTNSEIEERLKRLKYDDVGNDVNGEVKAKGFGKFVQFKNTQGSQVKNAVDASKNNPEGNVMMKEIIDVDQKCRDDFNTWYWNRVNLKEGKKLVSKGISTCDSSVHELFTRGSTEKCCNNYCKYVGNSSESVILG